MVEKNSWIDKVFQSESSKVEVISEDKVLNPFTTIRLRFYSGDMLVHETETIFKCDNLDGCFFCFTHDFSHVVLAVGREKKTIPTEYKGVYLWNGSPVLEDQFYESVEVAGSLLLAKKERQKLFLVFKSLLVEEVGGLFRIVVDHSSQSPIFTTCFVSREFS